MKQTFILLLLSLVGLVGRAQDFFPLVPGSSWVYRQTSGIGGVSPLTIRLGQPTVLNGTTYHRLQGYLANDVLIRRDDSGNFVFWDEASHAELAFLLFDGVEFRSYVSPCGQKGQSDGRPSEYKGPVGQFEGARTIRYTPGMCADLGLTSEIFVANLGLVRRTQTSFTGERSIDLVYAQIGGVTYLNDAGVSFSIAVIGLGREVAARLVLNNRGEAPLILQFNSGQTYDFILRDESGTEVYRWSADKLFTQAIKRLDVKGEEVWQDSFAPGKVPGGVYSVEGRLVNADGKQFSATANLTLP